MSHPTLSGPRRMVLACVLLASLSHGSLAAEPVPALDRLLRQSLSQHPTVQAARADALAAESDVGASEWQRFPAPALALETPGGRPSPVVSVTQPLWTGGRLTADIAAARAAAESARASVGVAQQTIALRLVDAWQQLSASESRIEVAERLLTRLRGFEAMMKRRVSAEVSPRSDQDLISARVLLAEDEVVQAQSLRDQALTRLAQLVGRPLDSGERAAARHLLEQAQAVAEDRSDAAGGVEGDQSLVSRHPAVLKARADAANREEVLKAREAAQWPQLVLKYQHQVNRPANPEPEKRWFLGLLYSPGGGFSASAQAEAARLRAQGAERSALASEQEVAEALVLDRRELASALQRERAYLLAIRGSESLLESYERQFAAGRRTWVDLLNGARELAQNEQSLGDSRAQVVAARYRLRVRASDYTQAPESTR